MFLVIKRETTIKVHDHQDLLSAWKIYGDRLVGHYVVTGKPLTESQLKRLPRRLRNIVECSDGPGVDWLDSLWKLPDTRAESPRNLPEN